MLSPEERKRRATEATKRWQRNNKSRVEAYRKDYMARRLQRDPSYHRWQGLRKSYGLTVADWERIFQSQNGQCAICGTNETKKWCVDHDHFVEVTTGEIVVRGILCSMCNLLLGHARDNESTLLSAAEYLRKHRGI